MFDSIKQLIVDADVESFELILCCSGKSCSNIYSETFLYALT